MSKQTWKIDTTKLQLLDNRVIRFKLCIVLVLFLSLFVSDIAGAVETSKQQDIVRLISLMCGGSYIEQFAEMLTTVVIDDMRRKDPSMPLGVEQAISRVVPQVVREEARWYTDQLVRIYDTHFTHSEINELIKFFSSPVGQKYGANLQSLTLEVYRVGQEFAQRMKPRFQELLGKELEKVLPD